MAFVWLNKQGVRSSEGFEVQFTGRFSAQYKEDGRTVSLQVEDGLTGGKPSIIVNPASFAQWDDGQAISAQQRDRMFNNLRNAIEFQGLLLTIQSPE